MNIAELIKGLKEQGLADEEIKKELIRIREEIDHILEPKEEPKEKVEEVVESDEEKEKRIFGI